MYFNPPQPGNNPANPFWHPLNQNLSEENRLTGMDQGEALKIYNKLKKGSEIEVQFGNAISSGGKPITLRVTSGHRIVGKSRVGRIILINPENPRGMKYKLFNRDGRISLAQSDMATILKSMKILKEDVQLDEKVKTAFDDFDMDTRAFLAKLKKFGFEKEYKKMIMNFNKHANSGDGFYFIDGGRELGFQVHPVADMMMGPKIKKLGDTQDLGGGKTVRLIAIKENVQLDESSLPAYDARLLRQALVLGKNAFKAGKKREPIKDKNLVSLRGFAKGKGKNEVMKQWLKGWDEENLKEDVRLDESNVYNPPKNSSAYYGSGSKKLGFGSFAIVDRYGSIIRVGLSEKQARRLVQPGQKVDNLPGAKVGQVLKKNNVPDFYREDVQLNEESMKVRVVFNKTKPGGGRKPLYQVYDELRDAKKKNMFVDAKETPGQSGKFRPDMFDMTFNSRRQFNRFESAYDFLIVDMLENVQVNEEKSLFDISPTSSKWMKGRLKTGYNQSQKSGMPKEVFKKGQVIDLHPFDGDRFVGAKSPKDKGSYFFVAKRNVDAMNESVQLGEKFEAKFPNKNIAQKFMRELSQERLGNSTGNAEGNVTFFTNAGRSTGKPTMTHIKIARLMKRHSGRLIRTDEGPEFARIFEATTPLRKKVAAAKAKLKKAGIASAFQFGELYVHDKDLKKAMSIIGGDRDLLLVGQPMPLTKDDLMDGI